MNVLFIKILAQVFAPYARTLAIMYETGDRVKQNYKKAFKYYDRIELPEDLAYRRAQCYIKAYGPSAKKDYKYEWLLKYAAWEGNRDAIRELFVKDIDKDDVIKYYNGLTKAEGKESAAIFIGDRYCSISDYDNAATWYSKCEKNGDAYYKLAELIWKHPYEKYSSEIYVDEPSEYINKGKALSYYKLAAEYHCSSSGYSKSIDSEKESEYNALKSKLERYKYEEEVIAARKRAEQEKREALKNQIIDTYNQSKKLSRSEMETYIRATSDKNNNKEVVDRASVKR